MPPIEFRGTQMVTGSLSSQLVPLCVCISSHEGACHDFLVILAMPTTCAHGTGVAIPLHSSYHTAITFEPLCSHIKPEGLTSSPLRGPTQWLVYNGTQQTGDCSSAVSYCAQLAHCASRVPARARSHRWWYSHPKHTGPCLLQREAHFRRVRASIDASRTQSGCLLLRSILAEAS